MKNIEWRHITWYSQLFAIVLFLDVFGLGIWLGLQIETTKVETAVAALQTNAMRSHAEHSTQATPAGSVITSANYKCDAGKTVEAVYTGNSVNLSLSDGRNENLLQSISADGGRYTNSDESFVFWSKGTGAFITEGSKTTYNNCTQASTTPAK